MLSKYYQFNKLKRGPGGKRIIFWNKIEKVKCDHPKFILEDFENNEITSPFGVL